MRVRRVTAGAWLLAAAIVFASPAADSERLARAKDFIADEQWSHAIAELQAAANDRGEPNRDEALFWLAHSEHAFGDQSAASQAIARLEREFPSSRWVRPAHSLRIEIAQTLHRDDFLWVIATPGAPLPPSPPPPLLRVPPVPRSPAPPPPPDTDLRIEALGGLIDAHADRAIPLLRDIALNARQPGEARRAVFVLAQSPAPEARNIVVDVAKRGAEPARLAAIRELGRFEGPAVGAQLLQVYQLAASPRVKRQVVSSLGERADTAALLGIAIRESDLSVRNTAIVTLGRTAPRDRLRMLYTQARPESRAAVLSALFNAKDEDGLIRIARTEKDRVLRECARQQLRMLGTPKAKAFLTAEPR